MAGFWVLEVRVTPDDVFILRYEAPDGLDDGCFDARPLPADQTTRLYYEHPAARKRDYVAGVFSCPVGSLRLCDVLDAAGVRDVQYLPAELTCTEDGTTDDGYRVINVLAKVEALDWERAQVEIFPGTERVVQWVQRLAVREDALEGHDLVRLAEFRSLVLVSTRLKARLEAEGITGVGFIAVEEYGGL